MSDLNAERATLAACLWSRTARDEARNHITGADFSDLWRWISSGFLPSRAARSTLPRTWTSRRSLRNPN